MHPLLHARPLLTCIIAFCSLECDGHRNPTHPPPETALGRLALGRRVGGLEREHFPRTQEAESGQTDQWSSGQPDQWSNAPHGAETRLDPEGRSEERRFRFPGSEERRFRYPGSGRADQTGGGASSGNRLRLGSEHDPARLESGLLGPSQVSNAFFVVIVITCLFATLGVQVPPSPPGPPIAGALVLPFFLPSFHIATDRLRPPCALFLPSRLLVSKLAPPPSSPPLTIKRDFCHGGMNLEECQ